MLTKRRSAQTELSKVVQHTAGVFHTDTNLRQVPWCILWQNDPPRHTYDSHHLHTTANINLQCSITLRSQMLSVTFNKVKNSPAL